MSHQLLAGLSESVALRIEQKLRKVWPYLDPKTTAIVGSVAIHYFYQQAGLPFHRENLGHCNFAINSAVALSPSVKEKFFISHHHPHSEEVPLPYFHLVDKEDGAKLNVFGWDFTPELVQEVSWGESQVLITTLPRQFAKLLLDTYRITRDRPIKRHWLTDLQEMSTIIDRAETQQLGTRLFGDRYPPSLEKALEEIKQGMADHPELVVEKSFSGRRPPTCPECIDVEPYRLDLPNEINRAMGYL